MTSRVLARLCAALACSLMGGCLVVEVELRADGGGTAHITVPANAFVLLKDSRPGHLFDGASPSHSVHGERMGIDLAFDDVAVLARLPLWRELGAPAPEVSRSADALGMRVEAEKLRDWSMRRRLAGEDEQQVVAAVRIAGPGDIEGSNAHHVRDRAASWNFTVLDLWKTLDPALEVRFRLAPETAAAVAGAAARPNVVVFMADDMGLGDVGVYDPTSTIPTPNFDRIAAEGIRFTDAHAPSSVCTPTRYSVLSGRYAFRSTLRDSVLRSAYAPPILDADHETVAGLMTRAGYDAAAFGKWHLGMRWSNRAGNGVPAIGLGISSTPDVDFSKPFADGPLQHGFRYFFGLASSINHDPYTFIENDRVTDLPTVRRPQKSVGNGAFREGWVADSWDDSQQGAVISGVALDWITRHVATSPRVPFFLYYAATANHVPHVPPAALRGQRVAGRGGADDGMPARNDMVVENDVILGLLLDRLEDPNGDGDRSDSIAGETLVMATSDNGADFGRYAGIRGRKGSIYEGGHRIPLLARWPGRIPAGAVTDQLISLVDLYATLAALTGTHPADGAAEDSENMLPAFVAAPCDRGPMLQQESGLANVFAVRDGDWKLIIRGDKAVELYDLGADRGERRNLVSVEPTVAARLLGHYRRIRGRDDRG